MLIITVVGSDESDAVVYELLQNDSISDRLCEVYTYIASTFFKMQ